jgi:hypothetical protein
MMATVMGGAAKAVNNGFLIDGLVCFTGDEIATIMTHTRGEYGGFRDTVSALLKLFGLREERKPEAVE